MADKKEWEEMGVRMDLISRVFGDSPEYTEDELNQFQKQQETAMDVTGSLGCWGVA